MGTSRLHAQQASDTAVEDVGAADGLAMSQPADVDTPAATPNDCQAQEQELGVDAFEDAVSDDGLAGGSGVALRKPSVLDDSDDDLLGGGSVAAPLQLNTVASEERLHEDAPLRQDDPEPVEPPRRDETTTSEPAPVVTAEATTSEPAQVVAAEASAASPNRRDVSPEGIVAVPPDPDGGEPPLGETRERDPAPVAAVGDSEDGGGDVSDDDLLGPASAPTAAAAEGKNDNDDDDDDDDLL